MILNVKSSGKGNPLILIHGLFGSLDNLGGLAKGLSEHFTVYQIDLPNHGQSPHNDDVSYESQANSVYRLLESLELPRVILVGHSMGGKVAMRVAQRWPERVEQLIVMDMAPVDYQTRRHDNVFAGLHASMKETLTSRKHAQTILSEHIVDPGVIQFLLKSLYRKDDGTYAWRFNTKALFDGYRDIIGWENCGIFTNPTLFIKGQNSDYITSEHRDAIGLQFPNAKAHMVANTGHWLHAEKPDTVARVIERFLITQER